MALQKSRDRHVLAAALILGAAIFTLAAVPQVEGFQGGVKPQPAPPAESPAAAKRNSRPESVAVAPLNTDEASDGALFAYEFRQPQFVIREIVIEHDSNGRGKITFQRQDTSIVEPLELSAAARTRILQLWEALNFLDSDTNYQSNSQFPHLGTMRLRMEKGDRQRTAEFNWTHNSHAAALIAEYRHLADQAILVFDIAVARENQPLNAPKLMEVLESMLRRSALSDPKQLVPLLQEITTDEHLPLIARNHAKRLLKKIEKL